MGRSTQDLLDTMNKLAGCKVSVVAMSGMTVELEKPHGRMMATMLAGIAQFERDLLRERVKSGLAAACARRKKLGRHPGQRPKSDKLAPKVIQAVADGRSYRWIARNLGSNKIPSWILRKDTAKTLRVSFCPLPDSTPLKESTAKCGAIRPPFAFLREISDRDTTARTWRGESRQARGPGFGA